MSFLELKNVSKSFGSRVALENISLSIEPGECFGLLGPNGAGKTTLISILGGFLHADQGTVTLKSERITPDSVTTRSKIGLVPQELAVYSSLTAEENLRFFGQLYGLSGSKLKNQVDSVLHSTGLTQRASERVETFSGGMQRRLNLGIALMHDPPLLLLDEPTVGVDPQSRNHLFEEVRRLHRLGTTILYTSHYMEEVEALCQRVGIIDHGQLVACDSLDRLITQVHGSIELKAATSLATLVSELHGTDEVIWNESKTHATIQVKAIPPVMEQILEQIRKDQVEVTDISTKQPTLEDVFLKLTGRALRD